MLFGKLWFDYLYLYAHAVGELVDEATDKWSVDNQFSITHDKFFYGDITCDRNMATQLGTYEEPVRAIIKRADAYYNNNHDYVWDTCLVEQCELIMSELSKRYVDTDMPDKITETVAMCFEVTYLVCANSLIIRRKTDRNKSILYTKSDKSKLICCNDDPHTVLKLCCKGLKIPDQQYTWTHALVSIRNKYKCGNTDVYINKLADILSLCCSEESLGNIRDTFLK